MLQDEIPFAHPVARFPVKKQPKLPPSFAAMKEVRIILLLFNCVITLQGAQGLTCAHDSSKHPRDKQVLFRSKNRV